MAVSYWEAFRAWWRIYWPTQLVSIVLMAVFSRWLVGNVNHWRAEHPLEASALERYLSILPLAISILAGAVCIWLFTPRILGRTYRGFRLAACVGADERSKVAVRQRTQLWFFVWWRQIAGGLLAMLLAMPLNMLLSTMKVNAAPQIAALAGLFAIGPIIIKMLVGHPFKGFHVEARRPVRTAGQPATGHAAPVNLP